MSMGFHVVRRAFALLGCCLVAGCASVGPDYTAPQVEVADRWQAALPHGGQTGALLDWWQRFDDPVLSELLTRAEADSPTLAESVARIDEARAGLGAAEAQNLPAVNANFKRMRNDIGDLVSGTIVPAQTTRSSTLDASWEIDIFGRVRRAGEAASARLAARSDEWHAARVSLAAEVAGKYVDYRACQLLSQAAAADAHSRQDTARISSVAAQAGLTAPADSHLARAGAAEAAAHLTGQQAACDLAVKSLVTLSGLGEVELRKLLQSGKAAIPQPAEFTVDKLPVALLAQRPDLTAVERELAAASADIGFFEADRFPRLSLLGSLEVDKTHGGATPTTVITKPWSFGPSLSLPLFNGGALAARQDEAQARFEQALARYRKAVRGAVEEVESVLVNLDSATQRAGQVHDAAAGFAAYAHAAEENWHAGGLSQLALEEARRFALAAERNEITVQRERVLNWIALYKALGGGWDAQNAGDREPLNILNTTNTTNTSIPPGESK